jgi:prepilin-type N-terminal cleavage/methylation domain-containing protein
MGLRRTTHCLTGRSAFTLIEVLVVVAIIGIAAAVVVPQMIRPGTLNAQAGARMIIADLLYAQNDAIAKQQVRRVVFDPTNNRYWLEDQGGSIISVNWKKNSGSGNYVVDFASDKRFAGVTISTASFGSGSEIEYDLLGGPSVGGTIDLVATGGPTYRITIAPLTGRVTVAPVTVTP